MAEKDLLVFWLDSRLGGFLLFLLLFLAEVGFGGGLDITVGVDRHYEVCHG